MMPVHHVPAAGTSFAVHTAGSGRPLVLLHGFPLDHRMWDSQAPLAGHLRLVAPDLRGFGSSGGFGAQGAFGASPMMPMGGAPSMGMGSSAPMAGMGQTVMNPQMGGMGMVGFLPYFLCTAVS